MAIPKEFMAFFLRLVDKSRKSEVNWEATGGKDTVRVTFSDIAINISLVGDKPEVRIQLLNDEGVPAAVMSVDDGDDEWLAAMSLINSANRRVTKIDRTMQRAMEELGKEGTVGQEPPAS